MRSFRLVTIVFALSATPLSKPTAPNHVDGVAFSHATTRTVIGALSDISSDYAHGRPVTLLQVLEFTPNWTPLEPKLLRVPVCGDYSEDLTFLVHTNIRVVYRLASPSKSTGCLILLNIQPWRDDNRWQTIVFDSSRLSPNPKSGPEIQHPTFPRQKKHE